MCRLRFAAIALVGLVLAAYSPNSTASEPSPITILALGDSLTAGYGLPKEDAFPPNLEAALSEKDYKARVINAGVSGDTTAGGRARLGWALSDNPDAAIVALGGNDALRGLTPQQMYDNLSAILTKLRDENIPALLAGMLAPPNLGTEYAQEFNEVFKRLSQEFDVVFYPFFLDGVAAEPSLNQPDGIHPNAEGVDLMVERIMPSVEELIARARTTSAGG